MRAVIAVAVFSVLIASCASSSSETTVAPAESIGCEDAPQQVLDYLATGFVNDALAFKSGQTVKSGDYPDVWIVAGALDNSQDLVGDAEAIGIWAIRSETWPTEYVGAVAVDNIAQVTTTWGESTDIIVTSATDGVMAAEACALAATSE